MWQRLCAETLDLSALSADALFPNHVRVSSFLGSLNIYPQESVCLGYVFMILWLLTWRVELWIYPIPYHLCVPVRPGVQQ